jgi:hypothetical protein
MPAKAGWRGEPNGGLDGGLAWIALLDLFGILFTLNINFQNHAKT